MANKCTGAESIYFDIPDCRGKKRLPGLLSKVYCIPRSWIVKWPSLAASITAYKDAVSYTDDFTLAADKKWIQVAAVDNQNQLTSESQGESPCKTFKNSLKFLLGGIGEEQVGYATLINNDDVIFIAVDRSGKARLIGNDMFQVQTSISGDSGTAPTDTMAVTVTAEVTDTLSLPFYSGKIVTADGIVNGATGEVTAPPTGSDS